MTNPNALLRWSSSASPSIFGAELDASALPMEQLRIRMQRVVPELGSARFLIVRIGSGSATSLEDTLAAYREAGGSTRVCLAGDMAALRAADALGLDDDATGLMLDDVSAQSSWSDLIWHRLEAVRFSTSFVSEAGGNVRTACAFDSILALARDVGLRTMGPPLPEQGMPLSHEQSFDFLLDATDRRFDPSSQLLTRLSRAASSPSP